MMRKGNKLNSGKKLGNLIYFNLNNKITAYFGFSFSNVEDLYSFINLLKDFSFKYTIVCVHECRTSRIQLYLKIKTRQTNEMFDVRDNLDARINTSEIRNGIKMDHHLVGNKIFTFFSDSEINRFNIVIEPIKKITYIENKDSGKRRIIQGLSVNLNSSDHEKWVSLSNFQEYLHIKSIFFFSFEQNIKISFTLLVIADEIGDISKFNNYIQDIGLWDKIKPIRTNVSLLISLIKKTRSKFQNRMNFDHFFQFFNIFGNKIQNVEQPNVRIGKDAIHSEGDLMNKFLEYLKGSLTTYTKTQKNIIIVPETNKIFLIQISLNFDEIYQFIERNYYECADLTILTNVDEIVRLKQILPELLELKKLSIKTLPNLINPKRLIECNSSSKISSFKQKNIPKNLRKINLYS